MPEGQKESGSLLDQIVSDTLQALSQHTEFDEATLERLHRVASDRKLTNEEHVQKALAQEQSGDLG